MARLPVAFVVALLIAFVPTPPVSHAAAALGNWTQTGSMNAPRAGHTMTLLPNGLVLVTGGVDTADAPQSTAELYDPATGVWTNTTSMGTARAWHSATLLTNGKVLVAGGHDPNYDPIATAELYDPATRTWTPTGSLHTPRANFGAILLADGRVLVMGGWPHSTDYAIGSAEIYDPATGLWTQTDDLNDPRAGPVLPILLPNGKVFIVGGNRCCPYSPYNSAEIFDPDTNTWTLTTPMSVERADPLATLLPSGVILVAGGWQGQGTTSTAELYDPATNTWAQTGALNKARGSQIGVLLPNGDVLTVGGADQYGESVVTGEMYDIEKGVWSLGPTEPTLRRDGHGVVLLPHGKVLVSGGRIFPTVFAMAAAELFDPTAVTPAPPCTLAPAGLVHWWPGNGDAQDIEGHANGALENGATFTEGKVGQAFHFDGVDDAIETAPTNSMNRLQFTIEAWVQPELRTDVPGGINNEMPFFPNNAVSNDWPYHNGHGFGVNVYPAGSSLIVEYPYGSRLIPGLTFQAGVWYHVAVVYTDGNYHAYVNGELVDDFDFPQGSTNGVNFVRIGKHNDDDETYDTERFFKGSIDEVTIYSRALSGGEIQAIYDAGDAGKCNSTASLSANLLTNPGFELDLNGDLRPDDWTSNSIVTRSQEQVHRGSYAMQHRVDLDSSYTIEQSVAHIQPGSPYAFSAWANVPPITDENGFTLTLAVAWRDGTGAITGTSTLLPITQTTQGWAVQEGVVTAPLGAATANVQMAVRNFQGTFYVDDLYFGNALSNPGFEQDSNTDERADGWQPQELALRTESDVHGGRYALHLQGSDNAAYDLASTPLVDIGAGKQYRVSAFVKIPATDDAFRFDIVIEWQDGFGAVNDSTLVRRFTAANRGKWRLMDETVTAPVGSQRAVLRLVVTSLSGSIYLDDLAIYPYEPVLGIHMHIPLVER